MNCRHAAAGEQSKSKHHQSGNEEKVNSCRAESKMLSLKRFSRRLLWIFLMIQTFWLTPAESGNLSSHSKEMRLPIQKDQCKQKENESKHMVFFSSTEALCLAIWMARKLVFAHFPLQEAGSNLCRAFMRTWNFHIEKQECERARPQWVRSVPPRRKVWTGKLSTIKDQKCESERVRPQQLGTAFSTTKHCG